LVTIIIDRHHHHHHQTIIFTLAKDVLPLVRLLSTRRQIHQSVIDPPHPAAALHLRVVLKTTKIASDLLRISRTLCRHR
jgi:hypothetical protein